MNENFWRERERETLLFFLSPQVPYFCTIISFFSLIKTAIYIYIYFVPVYLAGAQVPTVNLPKANDRAVPWVLSRAQPEGCVGCSSKPTLLHAIVQNWAGELLLWERCLLISFLFLIGIIKDSCLSIN